MMQVGDRVVVKEEVPRLGGARGNVVAPLFGIFDYKIRLEGVEEPVWMLEEDLLPVEVVVLEGKLRRNADGRTFVMTNEGRELCPFAHIGGDDEVRITIERVKKEG